MKPDWDKLADELKGNDKVLIADVDCTNDDNTELCEKYDVKGYPTIKSFVSGGDKLGETYEGGRDFESLKKHATENLSPVCSDTNYDLCDASEQALLDKYRTMRWPARKKPYRNKSSIWRGCSTRSERSSENGQRSGTN